MKFSEVIEQASALLQRKGRITYRALKREFHLDDDALEDLKFELITGQELAVDKDGDVLVWVGEQRVVSSQLSVLSPQPLVPSPQHLAPRRRRKPKRVSSKPSRFPVSSKPSPWNSAPR
jgi:hypothetical protein